MKGKRKKVKIKRTNALVKSQNHKNWSPERKEKILTQVKDLIEPLCEAEGMELVHLEYQREAGGRILRFYIDRPGGVTIDDCVYISRQSSDLLDVYLEDMGTYSLEVSSPGLRRPLGKKLDFERFKGSLAKIRTAQPIDGQKNFKGILLGISEGMVKLSIDDITVTIPYQEIARAHLDY